MCAVLGTKLRDAVKWYGCCWVCWTWLVILSPKSPVLFLYQSILGQEGPWDYPLWQFWCSYWLQGAWLHNQGRPGRAWARAFLQLSGPQICVPVLRCGKSLHVSEWLWCSPPDQEYIITLFKECKGLGIPKGFWGCRECVHVGAELCCCVAVSTSLGYSGDSAVPFSLEWRNSLLCWPSLRSKMKIMKRW